MALIFIGIAAFLTSGLTLFSGFGLGTLLLPVFALFFPLPLAIAATALVHFANNLFKFSLMAKQANWNVVMRFSLPAAFTALLGAQTLIYVEQLPALAHYSIGHFNFEVSAMKFIIGSLIVIFALLELSSRFQRLTFAPRWLSFGGAVSGFFGGLSGHQGALRSAFLLKAGLTKEAFIATGIVSALIVDVVRLAVYGTALLSNQVMQAQILALPVMVAMLSAFTGAFIGKRLLQKVTLHAVQHIVAIAMLGIGTGLLMGWL